MLQHMNHHTDKPPDTRAFDAETERIARKLETLPLPCLRALDLLVSLIETRPLTALKVTVNQLLKSAANKVWESHYTRGKYPS